MLTPLVLRPQVCLPDGRFVTPIPRTSLTTFNPSSKESRWEPPAGTDSEALKLYMGTYHSSANIRPDGAGAQEGKIRASHLLVKHRGSRRPSSWREAEITRTKEEAMSIILAQESRIRSGATSLGDLATTESDCSSSRKRGDL